MQSVSFAHVICNDGVSAVESIFVNEYVEMTHQTLHVDYKTANIWKITLNPKYNVCNV